MTPPYPTKRLVPGYHLSRSWGLLFGAFKRTSIFRLVEREANPPPTLPIVCVKKGRSPNPRYAHHLCFRDLPEKVWTSGNKASENTKSDAPTFESETPKRSRSPTAGLTLLPPTSCDEEVSRDFEVRRRAYLALVCIRRVVAGRRTRATKGTNRLRVFFVLCLAAPQEFAVDTGADRRCYILQMSTATNPASGQRDVQYTFTPKPRFSQDQRQRVFSISAVSGLGPRPYSQVTK